MNQRDIFDEPGGVLQVDRKRFPMLAAYADRLPHGFDSYPECSAKGALVPFVLKRRPFSGDLTTLPPRLAHLLENPPLSTQWIPEPLYLGLNLALADDARLSAVQCQNLWREIVLDMSKSRLYGVMLALLRPAGMLRSSSERWSRFHRGTTLVMTDAGDHFEIRMEFPPHLINRYLAQAYTGALQAIARTSATTVLDVTFVDATDTHARWSLARTEPSQDT